MDTPPAHAAKSTADSARGPAGQGAESAAADVFQQLLGRAAQRATGTAADAAGDAAGTARAALAASGEAAPGASSEDVPGESGDTESVEVSAATVLTAFFPLGPVPEPGRDAATVPDLLTACDTPPGGASGGAAPSGGTVTALAVPGTAAAGGAGGACFAPADAPKGAVAGATEPAATGWELAGSGSVADLGPAPRLAEAPSARTLHAPVGTPAWQGELGEELVWLAGRGEHSASLRLSPEHLGPLEVRIAVREGEATVYFGAAHTETRAALEQALPRLRELLAAQGLVLADAGVFRDAPRDPARAAIHAGGSGTPDDSGSHDEAAMPVTRAAGLIDTYA